VALFGRASSRDARIALSGDVGFEGGAGGGHRPSRGARVDRCARSRAAVRARVWRRGGDCPRCAHAPLGRHAARAEQAPHLVVRSRAHPGRPSRRGRDISAWHAGLSAHRFRLDPGRSLATDHRRDAGGLLGPRSGTRAALAVQRRRRRDLLAGRAAIHAERRQPGPRLRGDEQPRRRAHGPGSGGRYVHDGARAGRVLCQAGTGGLPGAAALHRGANARQGQGDGYLRRAGPRLRHGVALAAPVRLVEHAGLFRARRRLLGRCLRRSKDGRGRGHRHQRQPLHLGLVWRFAPLGSAIRKALL